MPGAAALDIVGVATVASLRRAATWTVNCVALCTHIRWITFTDIRVVRTATVDTRYYTVLDLRAGPVSGIKARDGARVQPSVITGA